ncbi:MAG: hypothetical protein OK438_06605 [Thaumarchaeota archaeon]|nr:hypothetical protein [Nitrososphaerota archaeon]
MSSYTWRVIKLGETWYLPLPKLAESQTRFIADRLRTKGYTVGGSRVFVARKGDTVLHVDPAGLCWSREDPSDAFGPALPDLLKMEREGLAIDQLRARYFSGGRSGGSLTVRFSTRMESSPLWADLRAAGECGLTPDERDVVLMVVRSSKEGCIFITDFPTEGSRVRVLGRRQYYESSLDPDAVSSTLRATGERRGRNSYLPKGGMLHFSSLLLPSHAKQAEFFAGLGEWCFLRPIIRESSNC